MPRAVHFNAACLAKNKICSTRVKVGSKYDRGIAVGDLLYILCNILETKDPKRLKTYLEPCLIFVLLMETLAQKLHFAVGLTIL